MNHVCRCNRRMARGVLTMDWHARMTYVVAVPAAMRIHARPGRLVGRIMHARVHAHRATDCTVAIRRVTHRIRFIAALMECGNRRLIVPTGANRTLLAQTTRALHPQIVRNVNDVQDNNASQCPTTRCAPPTVTPAPKISASPAPASTRLSCQTVARTHVVSHQTAAVRVARARLARSATLRPACVIRVAARSAR